jgi:hypothetical protein
MTLDAVARQLPSGFHDTFLRRLAIDYVKQQAVLDLSVSVGDPDATSHEEREAYRRAQVVISDFIWCIIEPSADKERTCAEGRWIDAGPVNTLKTKPALPEVPDGAFVW